MAIGDWYERTMVEGDRAGAFWLLLSLLVTFLIVRGSRAASAPTTAGAGARACCAT